MRNTRAVHAQRFPHETGAETVLRLTPQEAAAKRALLALYRSERKNLRHVRTEMASLHPLPRHDHAAPPHPGKLFCELFHWVPFRHPQIDAEPTSAVLQALADFSR